MTINLVAIDHESGKALYTVNETSVVINTQKIDVASIGSIARGWSKSDSWMKVASDIARPQVWDELAEAAVTKLEIARKEDVQTHRRFRVPMSVIEECNRALSWANGFERGSTHVSLRQANLLTSNRYVTLEDVSRVARYFANVSKKTTENSGWNDGEQGFPSDDRIKYGLWGGQAAFEWSQRVCSKHGLTADGSPPDPSLVADAPHTFEPDPESPAECVLCGGSADDDTHMQPPDTAEYFGKGVDPDSTEVTGMYMHRDDDTWAERVDGDWQNRAAPGDDEVVILLDPETAQQLQGILDGATEELPYELSMINSHESGLFYAALPEIDFESIDRMMEVYDPEERSINAGKQVRAGNGRFGPSGDGASPGTAEAPKARLKESLPLIPDVASRIDEYLKQVEAQRGGGATPVPATPTPAPETENAAGDPGNVTDVRPLYLAIVDKIDTDAVLDVVSLVPPEAGTTGDVSVWKRNAGTWVPAPEILSDLRGTSPPPCVELANDDTLKGVLDQVDTATADNAPEATPPTPSPTQDDGTPIEQSVTAGGPNSATREKLAKKGYALPDGSFPISNVSDLKNAVSAYGRAKNKTETRKHIMKRARGLNRPDLIPSAWKEAALLDIPDDNAMWGPHGQLIRTFDGGLDRNRGGAERLRRYWTHGEGAAKIGWGLDNGSWRRCVGYLTKYLGVRSRGYCTLRFHEVVGVWPGSKENNPGGHGGH